MRAFVTGSSGHLGEGLSHALTRDGHEVIGVDIRAGRYTTHLGRVSDRAFVGGLLPSVDVVFHTAALHKPHVATHARQDFVDTNVAGTLALLEEASAAGVGAFIFTSTTSVFGAAVRRVDGAPALWVTEDTPPRPKNIYGITKLAAEDMCELFHRRYDLACLVLRTSRFFPEEDDDRVMRETYSDDNLKANEYLFRRVDLEDVVGAHLLAARCARTIGFGKFIVSATSPFVPGDVEQLRGEAPHVVGRRVPGYEGEYRRRGWRMFPDIDRVYVNERARTALGWQPRHDFASVIDRLRLNEDLRSPLARLVGSKGYHAEKFLDGPYPVEKTISSRQ